MGTYNKTYNKTIRALWGKGDHKNNQAIPFLNNLLAYYRASDFDTPYWMSYKPTTSHTTRQVKGSAFTGAGTGAAAVTTEMTFTASGGDAPTCSVNGTLTIPGNCEDIRAYLDGELWAYWPGINIGGTFEIDASGNGHTLYLTDTSITERLDGTGTDWCNEMGYTVADGSQYLDNIGQDAIGPGWRIPSLTDGTGAASYSYISLFDETIGDGRLSPDDYRGNAPTAALSITTYDGSGQLTHPSVVYIPDGWNGHDYWMAATPLPGGDNQYENPSIWCSDDGSTWTVPGGLTNPIEPTPVPGYSSDTNLILADGVMYCFFRSTTGGSTYIYSLRSTDGVVWNNKTLHWSAPTTEVVLASPSVISNPSTTGYLVYAVKIGTRNDLVRFEVANITDPWTGMEVCTYDLENLWHMEVRYLDGLYILAAQDVEDTGSLFIGFSWDGATFTMATLPVVTSTGTWYERVYKSSIIPSISSGALLIDIFIAGVLGSVYKMGRTSASYINPAVYDANLADAIVPVSPFYGGDNFARVDGLLGTSPSGLVWTAVAGQPRIGNNLFTTIADGNNIATVNISQANFYAEMCVETLDGSTAWLVFRYVDSSNFWRVGYNTGQFKLQKVVTGAVTDIQVVTVMPIPSSTGRLVRSRIGVNCSGNVITPYFNRSKCGAYTDAAHASATGSGLQIGNTTTKISSITWRSAI